MVQRGQEPMQATPHPSSANHASRPSPATLARMTQVLWRMRAPQYRFGGLAASHMHSSHPKNSKAQNVDHAPDGATYLRSRATTPHTLLAHQARCRPSDRHSQARRSPRALARHCPQLHSAPAMVLMIPTTAHFASRSVPRSRPAHSPQSWRGQPQTDASVRLPAAHSPVPDCPRAQVV